MARTVEPYRDASLPERFMRWIETLRSRVGTIPCFNYSQGSPEGVIVGQNGDLYFDTIGLVYYVKTIDGGNTGWVQLATGAGNANFQGLGQWRYRTALGPSPAAGQLEFNNAIISNATEMYLNVVNDNGTDMSAFLALIQSGDLLYIQVTADSSQYVVVQTDTPTLAVGVYTFPILNIEGVGTTPANNTPVSLVVASLGAAGAGDVFKVGVPVNNQVGVWTGDGTIEGDVNLIWDGASLRLRGGADLFINTDDDAATALSIVPPATTAGTTNITGTGGINLAAAGATNLSFLTGGATRFQISGVNSRFVFNDFTIFMEEIPNAGPDVAAYGQWWVRNDTPNVPMFTNDAGTDFNLLAPVLFTVANESVDTTCFPLFVTDPTGALGPKSNAGLTFNSATGDLVATRVGGILNANLLDKSATEVITGAWRVNNAASDFVLGASTSLILRNPLDNSSYFINVVTAGLQFGIGGTDFNNTFCDFGASFTFFRFGDPLFIVERAADVADRVGEGQIWVRNDAPNVLMFTDDTGVEYQLNRAPTGTWTPTNVTTDRSYDANATTVDELADVLGTLIADLQTRGVLG